MSSDYPSPVSRLDDHPRRRALRDGPGGPYDGGMIDARVARLEDDMKEVKGDLKNVRERLARLEGAVDKLPGYGGIALIVGLIVGLSTLVQVAAKFMQSGIAPTP